MKRFLIINTLMVLSTSGVASAGIFEATQKSLLAALEMFEREEMRGKARFRTISTSVKDEEIVVQITVDDGKEQKVLSYVCFEYANGSDEQIYCNKEVGL